MHVRLTRHRTPPATLERAKIAAVKLEDNVERWIDLWIVFGTEEAGTFVEYRDPDTGQQLPAVLVHLEDGQNPLAPRGTALSRCGDCGAWGGLLATCRDPECEGAMIPYDGLSRFLELKGKGKAAAAGFWEALYSFVLAEEVPDPETGELRRLLDGAAS